MAIPRGINDCDFSSRIRDPRSTNSWYHLHSLASSLHPSYLFLFFISFFLSRNGHFRRYCIIFSPRFFVPEKRSIAVHPSIHPRSRISDLFGKALKRVNERAYNRDSEGTEREGKIVHLIFDAQPLKEKPLTSETRNFQEARGSSTLDFFEKKHFLDETLSERKSRAGQTRCRSTRGPPLPLLSSGKYFLFLLCTGPSRESAR